MKAETLNFRLKTVIIAIVFLLASCNHDSAYKESVVADSVEISDDFEVASPEKYNYKFTTGKVKTPKDLKIIKTATARYKVESVAIATRKIKTIAQKYGAYISDLRYTNDLYKKENRFTIKVPQTYFDLVMDSVNNVVDFVEYENITTKDVTEEYMDLESRLKTKLEVKKRYEDILRKNAKTVEDILKTEDKLRVLQEEIESAQGRLKYLTNKVSFSTIQIDLYETVDYVEEPTSYTKIFWSKTKENLSDGLLMIEALVLILFRIWPLVLLAFGVYFFLRRRFKK